MGKTSLGEGTPDEEGTGEKTLVTPPKQVAQVGAKPGTSPGASIEASPKSETPGGARPISARSTRLTPGGGYAALLAHARPRPPRADGTEKRTANSSADGPLAPSVAGSSDPLEVTAVGGIVPDSPLGRDDSRRALVATRKNSGPLGVDFEETTAVGGNIGIPLADGGSEGNRTEPRERKNAIPRPTRLTPGSGGVAALLAANRTRGETEPGGGRGASAARPAAKAPSSTDAATEATSPGDAAASAASETKKSGFANTLRPGIWTPQETHSLDSAPTTVSASIPEAKRGGLSGTLLGVPRPELDVSKGESDRAAAPGWVRMDASGSPGSVPSRIDDVEWTDRNSAIPGVDSGALNLADISSRPGAFGATAVDRRRTTAAFDVVQPTSRHRAAIGAGIVAAIFVATIGVLWSRSRPRPTPSGQVTAGPSAPVIEPVPSPPVAPGPPNQPTAIAPPVTAAVPVVGTSAAPSGTAPAAVAPGPEEPAREPRAAVTPPEPAAAQGVAAARVPGPAASESHDPPGTAPTAAEAPLVAATGTELAAHKKARRSERVATRPTRAKVKHKSAESRQRKESAVDRPPDGKVTTPRTRAPGGDGDPDGTLPLTGH
jgi:hypothetical protein